MLAMHHKSTRLGSGQDNSQGKLPRRLDPVPDDIVVGDVGHEMKVVIFISL